MKAPSGPGRDGVADDAEDTRPILVIPYMWIGDFVRCHTVVRVLKARWPNRPVDLLATPLTAPLADYMPGVRRAVVSDLPRRRLALGRQRRLAARLRAEGYGRVLVMPRTWKSALAPFLARIPERTGYLGEMRFVLLNDARTGERALPRMVDQCAALALPAGAAVPARWPVPELKVSPADVAAWRARRGLDLGQPVVALAPGSVGPSKRWTADGYGTAAADLVRQGLAVWVLGGPGEKQVAGEIVTQSGGRARDLTGDDLRDAVMGLAAAGAAVSNDSGLLHVAAALGTPSVGIFGPTDPRLWGPLNPLAATVETSTDVPCRPCHQPVCKLAHHRCMQEIPPAQVVEAVTRALGRADFAVAR